MGVSSSSWGYPISGWFFVRANTINIHQPKWMMTRATPIVSETSNWAVWLIKPVGFYDFCSATFHINPVVRRERSGAIGIFIFPIKWGATELLRVSQPSNSCNGDYYPPHIFVASTGGGFFPMPVRSRTTGPGRCVPGLGDTSDVPCHAARGRMGGCLGADTSWFHSDFMRISWGFRWNIMQIGNTWNVRSANRRWFTLRLRQAGKSRTKMEVHCWEKIFQPNAMLDWLVVWLPFFIFP